MPLINSLKDLLTPLPLGRNFPSFLNELTTKFTMSPDLKRAVRYSFSSKLGALLAFSHPFERPIGSFQEKPSEGL